ncbi:MAG: aldehyde dehydrogenase family protein [Chloroflexota bacterium]
MVAESTKERQQPPAKSDSTTAPAGTVLNAIDPATRKMIGTVPVTSEERIPEIVARARVAQQAWGSLPFAERAKALTMLRNVVVKRAEEIAETVSRSMGKPLVEALVGDVGLVLDEFDEYIQNGAEFLADEPVDVPAKFGTGKRALIRYVPRGVVCVIAPWNFPFGIAMGPLIPALAAGNSVILKPTSAAPMVGVLVEKLFQEAFRDHPDLVQVVHGPGKLGSAIATASGVDFVSFTGSTAVGRQIEAALAPLLRPALLELGGSDPAIVTDDANLERAANGIVWGRFMNNGQVCAAVKRVYVQRSVAEPFIQKVIEKVRTLRLGPYTDHSADVGPLANNRAIPALTEQLQDALNHGAKLETGGVIENTSAGLFWPPTVLTNVDSSMRVMNEEVFGPILPIQVVDDDEEAIREANRSESGLDAYVFCGDPERAERIANRLQAGTVDINEAIVNYVIAALPFGGIKQSGINRYHGKVGVRLFSNLKSMVIGDGKKDTEGYWFPYSDKTLKAVEDSLR